MAKAFQPPKKDKLTGILAIILYLVTGILLLIKPEWMAEFTRWALFAVLLAYAVISFWKYLRQEPEEAAQGYGLTGALISATLAVLALFDPSLLTDHIWGILLLAGGYMKFQTAMDMGRLGHQRWWLFLIPSAISLIFGVLITIDVIQVNTALFIGIALIVEGVVDIIALIMTMRSEALNRRAERKAKQEEEKEARQEREEARREKRNKRHGRKDGEENTAEDTAEEPAKPEADGEAKQEAAAPGNAEEEKPADP